MLLSSVLAALVAFSHGTTGQTVPANLPLRVAGVVVGYSRDSDVQQLYGRGHVEPEEGHTGGRYFIDTDANVTLHVVSGVDRIIEEASIQTGVSLEPKQRSAAKSAYLRRSDSIDGIRLGASVEAVVRAFGQPKSRTKKGNRVRLVYEVDYRSVPWVLFYKATFTFQDGILIAASIYNGE